MRLRRRLGRIKRRIKRTWWNRKVGKEYKAWLAYSSATEPGSVANSVPISVIVPVYNPPLAFLTQCLSSVLEQSASHWQLIVSDDGSSDPEVIAYLDEFTLIHQEDPRIHVMRGANGGISVAQNRALELVACEFFGWLDHDDTLNRLAIEKFSEALAQRSGIDVIYSDEDKIDSEGRHFDLYCKPDFSPELLLTQMYLCHFTAFRTSRVRELGKFRSEMDGAQDFDLALRLLPALSGAGVVHVPLPLYHWRAWSESTAQSIEAKPWAQEAAQRAQQEYLNHEFGGGQVAPSEVRGLNEVHPFVKGRPEVSVIIPTIGIPDARGVRLVEKCVASLRAQSMSVDLEIIAVTTVELEPIAGVDLQIVHTQDEFNFSSAINTGRTFATKEWLLLLNDDTEIVMPDSILHLVEIGQIPGVGVVGAKLTYPDGRLQHAGIVMLPSGPTHVHIAKPGRHQGYFGSTLTPRNFSAVTAAAMLVRASTFDEAEGFDTAFARDFNDVDFCLRVIELGYRVAWTPYAHLTHHEGVSIMRKEPDVAESEEFRRRWAASYQVDPFYSPALSPELSRVFEAR